MAQKTSLHRVQSDHTTTGNIYCKCNKTEIWDSQNGLHKDSILWHDADFYYRFENWKEVLSFEFILLVMILLLLLSFFRVII